MHYIPRRYMPFYVETLLFLTQAKRKKHLKVLLAKKETSDMLW